jgi:hypothetical protein
VYQIPDTDMCIRPPADAEEAELPCGIDGAAVGLNGPHAATQPLKGVRLTFAWSSKLKSGGIVGGCWWMMIPAFSSKLQSSGVWRIWWTSAVACDSNMGLMGSLDRHADAKAHVFAF